MKAFFYRPENAWVGDVIPYYEDGEFKLFYLLGWRENYRAEGACKIEAAPAIF